MNSTTNRDQPTVWHLFLPELVTALREGYGWNGARADLFDTAGAETAWKTRGASRA